LNIYDFEPIKVHVNEEVYYFYFKENLIEDDYEPVKEIHDNGKKILISRYHWRLLTIWTNLILKNGEARVSFGDNWHTPFVQCEYYRPQVVGLEPKGVDSKTGNKYVLLRLITLFLGYFFTQIPFKFNEPPIQYKDRLTKDKVDDKYIFTFDDMVGILVMGNSQDIPTEIIRKLRHRR